MDSKYIDLANDFMTELNNIDKNDISDTESFIPINDNNSLTPINETNPSIPINDEHPSTSITDEHPSTSITDINEKSFLPINDLTKTIIDLDFVINDDKEEKQEKIKKDDYDDLKKMSLFVEKEIFTKAVRNYNIAENIDIINMDKLKDNLINCQIASNYDVSFIYRDYKNANAYRNSSIYEYWVEVKKKHNSAETITINKDNKYLRCYIKNFQVTDKFRKKINNFNIRAFKKKVQILRLNLIIDIIFVIKDKNNK